MKKLANVRKVVISMCVGLILAVSGVAVVSAPAQAYVANCVVGYNLNGYVGAYAHCGGGTSTWYQVRVLCQNIFTKASVVRYGHGCQRAGSTHPLLVAASIGIRLSTELPGFRVISSILLNYNEETCLARKIEAFQLRW
jgi:hypothetical protein